MAIEIKTFVGELQTLVGNKIDNAHDDRANDDSDENEAWADAEVTTSTDDSFAIMIDGKVLRVRVDDITP